MYVQIRVHKCTSAPSFPPLPIRFSTQIPPSPYTHLGEDLCKRPIPKRPVGQNPPLTLKLFFGEFGQSGNQEKARKPLVLNVKKWIICMSVLVRRDHRPASLEAAICACHGFRHPIGTTSTPSFLLYANGATPHKTIIKDGSFILL